METTTSSSNAVQRCESLLQNFAKVCARALAKGDTVDCDRMAARYSKYVLELLAQEIDSVPLEEARRLMDSLWERNVQFGVIDRYYANIQSCAAFLPMMMRRSLTVLDRAGGGEEGDLALLVRGILDVYWECETTSGDMVGAQGIPYDEKPKPERHERAWQFRERLRTLKLQYLSKLRQSGQKIRVAFLVHRPAVWQYEGVYRLMEADAVFEPVVAVAPFPSAVDEEREHNRELCLERFGKDYNSIFFFDNFNHAEFRKQCKADIVFFTDPWGGVCSSYCIVSSMDCLACYAPYGVSSTNMQSSAFNKMFHHFLDFSFCETPIHVQIAKRYADDKGGCTIQTGYPKLDPLWQGKTNVPDPWGTPHNLKRIIWAPHFTVMENQHVQGYSCFFQIAEFMLEMARLFAGRLQFAFKPHPNLKGRLYKTLDWGIQRTDEYWNAWAAIPGCLTLETNHIPLFLHSDAMILDSVSFVTEYMATGNPLLFTVRDDSVRLKWNEYGNIAFNLCYFAENYEKEIGDFLTNVVVCEEDPLRERRIAFVNKNIVPPNGESASKNIYNILINLF